MVVEELDRLCRERARANRLEPIARRLGVTVGDLGGWGRRFGEDAVPFYKLTGVYFMRCQQFVKIGYSTHAPARMKEIQGATPFELDLLRLMPGTKIEESRYHLRFKHLRHRLEWFRYEDDLRDWLERPVACMLTDPTIRHQYGPLPV